MTDATTEWERDKLAEAVDADTERLLRLTEERDAALARAEVAERDERQARHDYESMMAERNLALGELESAESESATLRAELEEVRGHCRVLDEVKSKLRAENERLKVELEHAVKRNDDWCKQAYADRQALASANALLGEWHSNYAKHSKLSRLTKAHLDGQPAAARWAEFCAACMSPSGFCQCVGPRTAPDTAPPRTEAEHVDGCRFEREFPALDPEDCPRCSIASTPELDPVATKMLELQRMLTRTEAEQRVLDACAALHDRDIAYWMRHSKAYAEFATIAEAELARRGLTGG